MHAQDRVLAPEFVVPRIFFRIPSSPFLPLLISVKLGTDPTSTESLLSCDPRVVEDVIHEGARLH